MRPDRSPIYTYICSLRSRYAETDKMGYVYYGRYLEYFEVARTEMIRDLGMPYSEIEREGILLPVVETRIEYKVPVYYDEKMHIHVHLYDIPSVKLETWYEVYTEKRETPHVIGKVVLCFMREESRKPCRPPRKFVDGLKHKLTVDKR